MRDARDQRAEDAARESLPPGRYHVTGRSPLISVKRPSGLPLSRPADPASAPGCHAALLSEITVWAGTAPERCPNESHRRDG